MKVDCNLIIVTYPAGAAGKFIQNCLGLSQHCVLKEPKWAAWHCDNVSSPDLYSTKLTQALSTIPPNIQSWMSYELSDGKFYQDHHNTPWLTAISTAGLWTCISSHTFNYTKELSEIYSHVKHVIIEPGSEFRNQWLNLKSPDDPKIVWNINEMPADLSAFIFDVDNTIYNRAMFLQQISDLYTYLEFNDFNEEIVGIYYDRYINLHQIV